MHANWLCYIDNPLTNTQTPCNGRDDLIATVYNTSLLDIMKDTWSSKDYHISIILFCTSFIFPFFHIMNNLRLAFKQNSNIQVKIHQFIYIMYNIIF